MMTMMMSTTTTLRYNVAAFIVLVTIVVSIGATTVNAVGKKNLLKRSNTRGYDDGYSYDDASNNVNATTGNQYQESEGILGTSGAGGICTCPDGQTYVVADNYNDCETLQCEGGTSELKCAPGYQYAAENHKRGWGVVCASTGGADNGSDKISTKEQRNYRATRQLPFENDYSLGETTCPVEKGFCVLPDGSDQNNGVIKINSVDGNTDAAQEVCLAACQAYGGATGCEVIWDQGNRGCYVMTDTVDHGNNNDRHLCWVFSKCGDDYAIEMTIEPTSYTSSGHSSHSSSISMAATVPVRSTGTVVPTKAKDTCTEIQPDVILKETLGNPSDEFSYLDSAVQIITNSQRNIDIVTFTVSQVWLKQGAPMISVQYPGGKNKEDICNMEAFSNDGAPLIEFGATDEYTAKCTHGYAHISVFLYVGDIVNFDIEECESCSAPSIDYVGYYLTLPCVSMCEGSGIVQQATPTVVPSITTVITDDPVACPEDVTLIRKIGSTEFPVDKAVKIISQDTKTVTVELNQAWTASSTIGQIYASFKDNPFDRHCFETDNVEEGLYDTVTITCNFLSPKAYLEICVVDDLTNDILSSNDQATVPKCCHSEFPPETPVVCYSLEINCVTKCIEETQQRKLKLPFFSSSSSSSSSLRATARKLK